MDENIFNVDPNDTIQIAKDDIIKRMSPRQKEVYNMIINTIKELKKLPPEYGVELEV